MKALRGSRVAMPLFVNGVGETDEEPNNQM
jgi:hypothetical protein